MRYFELFNLPVSYIVDLTLLNQRYLELQRAVHPDKFAGKSEREKLMAVQKTSEINDALAVLKHPAKRAEYMLSEQGVDIRAEQQTLQDPAFLMQQMELREALEDIQHSSDPETEIDAFEAQIKQLDTQYSAQLAEQLVSQDTDVLEVAADNIRKLKFIYKLREELSRIEDSLFD
ncbi:co-chaperone HscB [Pseudoalteromonas luteoviolacea]|uniref:Co-chaperone protein HscB homolog n=1 Tax=Pseudoalteromonas luteoviolacea S4054 TaxID=1129367 RepID=A0A0F6A5U5_9GAMM|nr:co-chaperone HscB [Pseudoalteromonas luteoviolacea]AOT07119.1 cobalamin 5'-phosphate synthase [Pseudoalteromonas luteoviolacea]AOT12036.1 cobalamin 5'-phosphate synthase [Pseudoalteromonas luteoviolacea]AOT16949.1 cobalamin 5'-phosphate synthase [Pseudoalteromonas luteoviolacea]KKE81535.1 cobalamin (5'-phosphate) synthase [Pseudoalteromonas luteoviolacea S4054]KZN70023.1 cobalamin (5'-phosphate) synthase [Pseudoalteromonas luteoviolacea S4047-1]